jgi:hypothetical protein
MRGRGVSLSVQRGHPADNQMCCDPPALSQLGSSHPTFNTHALQGVRRAALRKSYNNLIAR